MSSLGIVPSLCANITEAPSPWKISVEGGEGERSNLRCLNKRFLVLILDFFGGGEEATPAGLYELQDRCA